MIARIQTKLKERIKKYTLQFLAVLAIVSGITTYLAFTQSGDGAPDPTLVLVLLNMDLFLLAFFCVLIAHRLIRMRQERKRRKAGSSLELRFVALFGAGAVIPTICVALFSVFFFNIGLQNWFSKQVFTAVNESYYVARAYLDEHRKNIKADVLYISGSITQDDEVRTGPIGEQKMFLENQMSIKDLDELVVIGERGEILFRSGVDAKFYVEEIPAGIEKDLESGEVVMLKTVLEDRVRAIYKLPLKEPVYLLAGRKIDPSILRHIDRARVAIDKYRLLEGQKSYFEITFNLIYLTVALLILVVAVWFGMTWADQITQPVKVLIGASDQITKGERKVAVPEEIGTIEEFNTLATSFNRMVAELETQKTTLVHANAELEERRRQIEIVLAGVSAGVIAVNAKGVLRFYNTAAESLLRINPERMETETLQTLMPGFWEMIEKEQWIREISHDDKTFSVKVAIEKQKSTDKIIGYILTFDDLTPLMTAQKKAAWGDVAQRLAHEIKNPLTPLQLATEKLEKYQKYLPQEERKDFGLYTKMVKSKATGLQKMLDEFSQFARLPDLARHAMDFAALVKETVLVYRKAYPKIAFAVKAPQKCKLFADEKQLEQVLVNLIKNAIEAIEKEKKPEITIILQRKTKKIVLTVKDNGPGFKEPYPLLIEPYKTMKKTGSGLGLLIVARIIEQHGGDIYLESKNGAVVTVELPGGEA